MTKIRDEAIAWCTRLARDRAQVAWSIKLTPDKIDSSPATQLAWRAHLAAKDKFGKETPPRVIWAEAERLLRHGWGDPSERPPAPVPPIQPPPPPRPPPESAPPPKPPRQKPPKPPKPQKPPRQIEPPKARMAKKQTRRTISVSKTTYETAKTFAAKKGVSLSQLTEIALRYAIEHFYKDKHP